MSTVKSQAKQRKIIILIYFAGEGSTKKESGRAAGFRFYTQTNCPSRAKVWRFPARGKSTAVWPKGQTQKGA